MSIHDLISTISVLFGLTAIGASLITYLQTSRHSTTIDTLSKDNLALRNRVETLEDIEEECNKRLSQLESQNRVLTETVTSAAKVDELSIKVTNHHDQVVSLLNKLATQ